MSSSDNEFRPVVQHHRPVKGVSMSNIAWIGLGHMGIPMSKHFVDAGHTVRGVDLDEGARTRASENGVEVGYSIADAVRDADIVCTMLPSANQVTAVLTGPDGAFALMPE